MSRDQTGPRPLLSLRAAVVLLIGAMAAISTAVLTYLAGNPPAAAVLAGGAAFGTSVALSHSLIG